MTRQRPAPFAAALRGAKAAVDPQGIMNPGVLIDPLRMKIAVLGPGGVGGLVAGALDRAGERSWSSRASRPPQTIAEHGLRVSSVMLGDFVARPRAVARLDEPVDVLIVATKAAGLAAALERVDAQPPLVLPLLNGLDHIAVLRERFAPETRARGHDPRRGRPARAGRDRAHEPVPARRHGEPLRRRAGADARRSPTPCSGAGVPVRVLDSEAQVMWSKLVRLNALACTTSAYDKLLGEIRSTPELRADFVGGDRGGAAPSARAEGAEDVDPQTALAELERAHDDARQLDAARHRRRAPARARRDPRRGAARGARATASSCPTIERLVAMIAARAGVPVPAVSG